MAERSNFAQTCNLLSQYLKEKRSQYLQGDSFGVKPAPATMNLLNTMETSPAAAAAASLEQPRSAPMTIFYNGQVLIFSDLSAEKAKEIMGLATQGSNPMVSSTESNVVVKPQQKQQQQPLQAIGSDLPIMRRNSLHKFLAKRKERVIAVAPYQVNHNQRAESPKAEEEQSGGQSSKQLELRL